MAAAARMLIAAGLLQPGTGDKSPSRPHTATSHSTRRNTNTAPEHVTSRNTNTAKEHVTWPRTATEHATPPNTNTATERVTSPVPGSSTGRPTLVDGTDIWDLIAEHGGSSNSPDGGKETWTLIGDPDLEEIVALLMWLSQQFQGAIPLNVISNTAVDTIIKCGDTPDGYAWNSLDLLHTDALAKLSQIISIMMLPHPKYSNSVDPATLKDPNVTLAFMRRVARFRDEVIRSTGRHTATERVELNRDDVSLCYQRFGRDYITHDLLPHQIGKAVYKLRNNFDGDTSLSGKQRSFMDSILRNVLGEKKVAYRIWQYGLPCIINIDMRLRLDVRLLQSSMDECIRWYVSLANDTTAHQAQPAYAGQLAASSLDQEEQQRQHRRREALRAARDAMRLGESLVLQRDSNKRSYNDMNASEQQVIEEYETGRTKRVKLDHAIPVLQVFRSSHSTATQHADTQ